MGTCYLISIINCVVKIIYQVFVRFNTRLAESSKLYLLSLKYLKQFKYLRHFSVVPRVFLGIFWYMYQERDFNESIGEYTVGQKAQ